MCKRLRMGGEVMKLRNCPVCRKLFVYTFKNKCPDCIKKDEEELKKVKDYIIKNPNSTIEKITEKTGVKGKKVLEFLREGRLILKYANEDLLSCQMCNKPILSGKYCEECAKDVKFKIQTAVNKPMETKSDMSGKIHLSKFQRGKR
jgi:flagellar operon protein (TIGR03826 family)